MAAALIGLGSNVGDRPKTLERALDLIANNGQVTSVTTSRWHETLPIGGPSGQGAFLNAAARIETSLEPEALLKLLHQIEKQLGRKRDVRWDERTLDLDLLLYDDLVMKSPSLQVPHPMMAMRRFVLEPAAEIAADMQHPLLGRSVKSLFTHLEQAVPYAAIAGGEQAERIGLVYRLSGAVRARTIFDTTDSAASSEANRASPTGDRWLEFLHDRSARIESANWLERTRWCVSSFWLGEVGWALSDELDEATRSGIGYAWWHAQQVTMPAKLVIIIDPMYRFDASFVAAQWRKLTAEPMMPFLLLRSADPDTQLAEAAAAMQAMQ